jgi:hypothetical protein
MDPIELLKQIKGRRPLRELAQEIGVSVPFLSYVLNRQRDPGPTILKFLGVERTETVRYRRINGRRGHKNGT